MTTTRTIGARLRELRGGATQAEAADKAGVLQSTWSRLERGSITDSSDLWHIADSYNVNIEWLYRERGPKLRMDAKGHEVITSSLQKLSTDELAAIELIVSRLAND